MTKTAGYGSDQNSWIRIWPKQLDTDLTKTTGSGSDQNSRIRIWQKQPDPDLTKTAGNGSDQNSLIRIWPKQLNPDLTKTVGSGSDQKSRIRIWPKEPDPPPWLCVFNLRDPSNPLLISSFNNDAIQNINQKNDKQCLEDYSGGDKGMANFPIPEFENRGGGEKKGKWKGINWQNVTYS